MNGIAFHFVADLMCSHLELQYELDMYVRSAFQDIPPEKTI